MTSIDQEPCTIRLMRSSGTLIPDHRADQAEVQHRSPGLHDPVSANRHGSKMLSRTTTLSQNGHRVRDWSPRPGSYRTKSVIRWQPRISEYAEYEDANGEWQYDSRTRLGQARTVTRWNTVRVAQDKYPGVVTRSEWNAVHQGMSMTRVHAIFGTSGTADGSYSYNGNRDVYREYRSASSFGGDLRINFDNYTQTGSGMRLYSRAGTSGDRGLQLMNVRPASLSLGGGPVKPSAWSRVGARPGIPMVRHVLPVLLPGGHDGSSDPPRPFSRGGGEKGTGEQPGSTSRPRLNHLRKGRPGPRSKRYVASCFATGTSRRNYPQSTSAGRPGPRPNNSEDRAK